MTTPSRTPWGTGLTVAAFVAAVTAAAAIVLCTGGAIFSLTVALLDWWVYG